jgi:hypothetical protein
VSAVSAMPVYAEVVEAKSHSDGAASPEFPRFVAAEAPGSLSVYGLEGSTVERCRRGYAEGGGSVGTGNKGLLRYSWASGTIGDGLFCSSGRRARTK